ECVFERLPSLGDVPARRPERRERRGDPQQELAVAVLARPPDRRAEVGVVLPEARDGRLLVAASGFGIEGFGELGEPAGVTKAELVELPGGLELYRRVLADRLQHPEAGLAVGVRPPEEKALLEQRIEPIQDGSGRAVVTADALGRLGPRAADEHGQPPEQPLLLLREQAVAPVDRVAQRPLALVDVARSTGQQRQPLVEAA